MEWSRNRHPSPTLPHSMPFVTIITMEGHRVEVMGPCQRTPFFRVVCEVFFADLHAQGLCSVCWFELSVY